MQFVEEYRVVDKSKWAGPWDAEPDKVVWVDPRTNLDCMAHRGPLGSWCGYVGVPEGHPDFGQGYDDVAASAHGGLTYGAKCCPTDDPGGGLCHIPQAGRPVDVWWLGFDCAHWQDYVPGMREPIASLEAQGIPWPLRDQGWGEEYRTLDYVVAEVTDLAAQLAEPHELAS